MIGQLTKPIHRSQSRYDEIPFQAMQIEMELDETIEENPQLLSNEFKIDPKELIAEFSLPKKNAFILTVDTSLSMTGEKLALTAVALSVVLLQFPDDPIGIIAFENHPKVLKLPTEKITAEELIGRFLEVPAKGYTHLESGIKMALKCIELIPQAGLSAPPSTLLLTDGKYTAGRDPAYLGSLFKHLIVLKMGNERSSRSLCKELAKRGNGTLMEIEDLRTLPTVMLNVVKDLLRGRSL